MTKGEIIEYAIKKKCQEYSLIEWCESWDITVDDFYKFLKFGREKFDKENGEWRMKNEDSPWLLPRLLYVKLKDNHISILEPIEGDVCIYFVRDNGVVEEKIKLRDYNGKSLFMTLPKEWIEKNILIKYTRYLV